MISERRTRKSDCALGESERGGDSPLDQSTPAKNPPVAAVCRFCTLHRRNHRIRLSSSAAFGQVCRNCTGTLSLPPNDRQILRPSDASGTASPLVGQAFRRHIEQRHRRCSTEHRMSVGLRGSSDAGGLLCRTNCHTQSRRGHPCRPQRSTNSSPIHRAQEVLVLESVPELLTQVASRVAALKTLEGALLSLC